MFSERGARAQARDYRRHGPDATSRQIVDLLKERGVEGLTLLEVGGGIGAIQIELLKAGLARAVSVELTPSYEDSAAELLREAGLHDRVERKVMDFVEAHWSDPDEGIWEVRGPRRHFVHSRVMAWVAVDRAVQGVEQYGLEGPVERWRELRRAIHADVCDHGFDSTKGAFTQYYGSDVLDASVLMIPLVGFLPASDPRVRSTVEAIERELVVDGFVRRYQNEAGVDGVAGGEGVFLACSFWLADNLALLGRLDDAQALFERLLGVGSDLGLFSEEYDPAAKRLIGNYPQAFSHVGLVNTAFNLQAALRSVSSAAPGWPSSPSRGQLA